ncbi:MAG: hypothetical protein AAFX04_07005 [Pseudomonadota bacterium]
MLITSAYILVALLLLGSFSYSEIMVRQFLQGQDLFIACALILLWFAMARRPATGVDFSSLRLSNTGFWLSCSALLLLGWVGHWLVLHGYHFSRDEQMAVMDARIFSNGDLIARLPDFWRETHDSLNVIFTVESLRGYAWLSSYRPVNALFQMLFGSWSSPFFSALGLWATWRIAIRLWPENREAHWVAVLLYAMSAQIFLLSMTSYAMAGHLGLNMLWLWLFLHDRWYSHVAAITVGLAATGLHQLVYHPLFAGPILALILWQRRWWLAAFYAGAYALIIMLWALWLKLPLAMVDEPLAIVTRDTDSFFLTRLSWALEELSWENIAVQSANMVRFFTWQHALMLPLLLVGVRAALTSRKPLYWAFIGVLITTIMVKLLLRPYQGHGWGYRYMHGLMGVAVLLATLGWVELRARNLLSQTQWRIATAFTALAIIPWYLWQASSLSGVFADLSERLDRQNVDLLIIDDDAGPFAVDLVTNDPYLANRPLRLRGSTLEPDDIDRLCQRYTVSFMTVAEYGALMRKFNWGNREASSYMAPLIARADALSCTVSLRQ